MYAVLAHPIVCIDPGHGGYDPGAVHGDAREKDITLHIGLQLRDILKRLGFQVVMTRDTDTSPGGYTKVAADLNERCRIANAAGADVFLSMHVNAGGGHGAEIYVNGDGGPIAQLAHGIVDNVATVCGYHGQPVRDGGSTGEGWHVIVGTDMDAMLLEVGFIDTDDLQKIQAHIDELAPQIASAFCAFYGMSYPEAQTPKQVSPKLDPLAAKVVIDQLGALTKGANTVALVACNFAANSARRAAGLPIEQDLGKPAVDAAQLITDIAHEMWHVADSPALQAVWAHIATTNREQLGCQ